MWNITDTFFNYFFYTIHNLKFVEQTIVFLQMGKIFQGEISKPDQTCKRVVGFLKRKYAM